jgi:ATP-dependent DNA helicase RecG
MQQNLLLELIKKGEDQTLEFKRKVTGSMGEEICAMANSGGGFILVGVDNDGSITGCDPRSSKESISQHLINIIPPVTISFDEIKLDGRNILVVEVNKSQNLCSIGGMVFIRTGVVKRPLSIQELFQMGAENLLFFADRSSTGVKEIDKDSIDRFFADSRTKILNPEKYLDRMNVWTKDGFLSIAGLLMFGKDPQIVLPHTSVRIIYQDDTWIRLSGTYPMIVDAAEKEFMARIPIVSRKIGFKREDKRIFSVTALKEALVNAMVHRNLAIHSEVFVYLYTDRIQISNPGSFPPGVTPMDPHPIARNPTLYELMFQANYVERQGRGIDMIIDESQKAGVECEYDLSQNFTTLNFYRTSSSYNASMQGIIKVLSESDRNAVEIAERAGLSRMTVLRNIKKLIELDKVERIGSGPSTRYHLK